MAKRLKTSRTGVDRLLDPENTSITLNTMAKVAKPNQDMRFDVPVIGPDTISTAASAGVDVISIEAGKTLLLGKEQIIRSCAEMRVTLVALE